jgi:predicted transposase/invertase (TIGR01784 family)
MTIKRHDPFFRKALENPLVAQEFFNTHLPEDIKKLIDLNSLKLEQDTFVEPNLTKTACDVLFAVNFADSKGYLYILAEQQLKPDPLMAFRLFKYMISICDKHLSQNQGTKKLPIVIPILFYNGEQQYNVARNIWDLFIDEKLARRFWTEDYQLINVYSIPDEELKKRVWSGTIEFLMRVFKL